MIYKMNEKQYQKLLKGGDGAKPMTPQGILDYVNTVYAHNGETFTLGVNPDTLKMEIKHHEPIYKITRVI